MSNSFSNLQRFRLRFGFRGLLVIVAVVAVIFGTKAKNVRDQRIAIRTIEALSGRCKYDYYEKTPGSWTGNICPTPMWLRNLLGDDWFHDITWVHLEGDKISDEDLKVICHCLPNLDTLFIYYNRTVSERGFAHIRKLRELRRLGLQETQVSDVALGHFRELSKLQHLELNGTPVTFSGLTQLQDLPALEKLWIDDEPFSNAQQERLQILFPRCDI